MLEPRSALYVFAVDLALQPMFGVVGGSVRWLRSAFFFIAKSAAAAAARLRAVTLASCGTPLLICGANASIARRSTATQLPARPTAAPATSAGSPNQAAACPAEFRLRQRRLRARSSTAGATVCRCPPPIRHPARLTSPSVLLFAGLTVVALVAELVADRLGALGFGHARGREAGESPALGRRSQLVARVPGGLPRHGHGLSRERPALRRRDGRPGAPCSEAGPGWPRTCCCSAACPRPG